MLIKQKYSVKNFSLSGRKSPITYTFGGVRHIKVSLQKAPDDSFYKASDNVIIVCATGRFNQSEKIKRYFDCIADNKLPDEMANNAKVTEYLNNTAKTVERLPIKFFPKPFKDYINNVRLELTDIIKRTINILRWRCAIRGKHTNAAVPGMAFTIDGKKWHMVPSGVSVHIGGVFSIPPTPQNISLFIKKSIRENQDEPLGHQLFREAIDLQHSNPRVAIVLAISALEVAVKECLSQFVPDSSWIIENIPSPPIRKIINEYLPDILKDKAPARNVFPLPPFLDKSIEKGISKRNKITHLGAKAPNRDQIDKIICAVQDIIWLLDFCSGHDWALENISSDTMDYLRSKMNNIKFNEDKYRITIKEI